MADNNKFDPNIDYSEDPYGQAMEKGAEFAGDVAKDGAKFVADKATGNARQTIKRGAKSLADNTVGRIPGVKALGRGVKSVARGVNKAANIATAPIRFVKKIIRTIILVCSGFLLICALAVVLFAGFAYVFDLAKQKVQEVADNVSNWWTKLTNEAIYEQDYLEAWNNGKDPDLTAATLEALTEEYEKITTEQEAADAAGEETDFDVHDSLFNVMREETLFTSPQDKLWFLEQCATYNNDMFLMRDAYYEYAQWELTTDYLIIGDGFHWNETEDVIQHTSDNVDDESDNIYENLTRRHIEGEENISEEKIFSVHWQDVMTAGILYGMGNQKVWGNEAAGLSSEDYDPTATENRINGSEGYFLSDTMRDEVMSLFKYSFSYYDGADIVDEAEWHESNGSAYKYSGYLNGSVKTSYRYIRVPAPDNPDVEVANRGTESEREADYDGFEYPYTKFVPESAPDVISNSYEKYVYEYIPTSEVPDYTPTEADFTAPEGYYCVGRWHVINSVPFVTYLNNIYPYYSDIADDKIKGGDYDYDWAQELIKFYVWELELMGSTSTRHGVSISQFYNYLADLYSDNKVAISYEGVIYDEAALNEKMATFIPAGFDYVIIDRDFNTYDSLSELASAQPTVTLTEFINTTQPAREDLEWVSDPNEYPFWSYGVTYCPKGSEIVSGDDNSVNTDVQGETSGDVYIYYGDYSSKKYTVDGWLTIYDGADVPLDSVSRGYSRSQIYSMLNYLENKRGNGSIPFTEATDMMVSFQSKYPYADIAGLLGVIIAEGQYKLGTTHAKNYNFLDFKATKGEANNGWYYVSPASPKSKWWSARNESISYYEGLGQSYTEGDLVGYSLYRACEKVYKNYWCRDGETSTGRQNTYYAMCFNGYYYPGSEENTVEQNRSEAEQAEQHMDVAVGHCYCPWWDSGFALNGKSSSCWCNIAAMARKSLHQEAGVSD